MKDEQISKNAYIKFKIYACKGGSASITPWTGLDCAIMHAKELLEAGFTVQIRPYTMEEWAANAH